MTDNHLARLQAARERNATSANAGIEKNRDSNQSKEAISTEKSHTRKEIASENLAHKEKMTLQKWERDDEKHKDKINGQVEGKRIEQETTLAQLQYEFETLTERLEIGRADYADRESIRLQYEQQSALIERAGQVNQTTLKIAENNAASANVIAELKAAGQAELYVFGGKMALEDHFHRDEQSRHERHIEMENVKTDNLIRVSRESGSADTAQTLDMAIDKLRQQDNSGQGQDRQGEDPRKDFVDGGTDYSRKP